MSLHYSGEERFLGLMCCVLYAHCDKVRKFASSDQREHLLTETHAAFQNLPDHISSPRCPHTIKRILLIQRHHQTSLQISPTSLILVSKTRSLDKTSQDHSPTNIQVLLAQERRPCNSSILPPRQSLPARPLQVQHRSEARIEVPPIRSGVSPTFTPAYPE